MEVEAARVPSGKGSGARRLAVGVLAGAGAMLLWGLVFVAPQLLPSYGAVEIALGRYAFYGAASAVVLLAVSLRGSGGAFREHGKKVWLTALLFAFAGNIGYYLLVVLGIRLAGAAVTTVVIGTLPVTVALAGNFWRREFPFRRLVVPVALILAGLLAVNLLGAGGEGAGASGGGRFFGLLFAFLALALWTFYGVANASFLRANPRISGWAWTTMVGVGTLVLALLAAPLAVVVAPGSVDFGRFARPDASLAWFLAVSAFLGVAVSWGATLLWNRASALLPTALAGQIIVLETVSGLAYVFAADRALPSAPDLVGTAALVLGVLVGINLTRARPRQTPRTGG